MFEFYIDIGLGLLLLFRLGFGLHLVLVRFVVGIRILVVLRIHIGFLFGFAFLFLLELVILFAFNLLLLFKVAVGGADLRPAGRIVFRVADLAAVIRIFGVGRYTFRFDEAVTVHQSMDAIVNRVAQIGRADQGVLPAQTGITFHLPESAVAARSTIALKVYLLLFVGIPVGIHLVRFDVQISIRIAVGFDVRIGIRIEIAVGVAIDFTRGIFIRVRFVVVVLIQIAVHRRLLFCICFIVVPIAIDSHTLALDTDSSVQIAVLDADEFTLHAQGAPGPVAAGLASIAYGFNIPIKIPIAVYNRFVEVSVSVAVLGRYLCYIGIAVRHRLRPVAIRPVVTVERRVADTVRGAQTSRSAIRVEATLVRRGAWTQARRYAVTQVADLVVAAVAVGQASVDILVTIDDGSLRAGAGGEDNMY